MVITWRDRVAGCRDLAGSTQLVELRRFTYNLAPKEAVWGPKIKIFEFWAFFRRGGRAGVQRTFCISTWGTPFGRVFSVGVPRIGTARWELPCPASLTLKCISFFCLPPFLFYLIFLLFFPLFSFFTFSSLLPLHRLIHVASCKWWRESLFHQTSFLKFR